MTGELGVSRSVKNHLPGLFRNRNRATFQDRTRSRGEGGPGGGGLATHLAWPARIQILSFGDVGSF